MWTQGLPPQFPKLSPHPIKQGTSQKPHGPSFSFPLFISATKLVHLNSVVSHGHVLPGLHHPCFLEPQNLQTFTSPKTWSLSDANLMTRHGCWPVQGLFCSKHKGKILNTALGACLLLTHVCPCWLSAPSLLCSCVTPVCAHLVFLGRSFLTPPTTHSSFSSKELLLTFQVFAQSLFLPSGKSTQFILPRKKITTVCS